MYRLRLGISRRLMRSVAMGLTLNSGVVNCRRFELPPTFRLRIGVVVSVALALALAMAGFFCSIFNSIKSFVLDAMPAAMADADDDDGADAFAPEFVFIAMVC